MDSIAQNKKKKPEPSPPIGGIKPPGTFVTKDGKPTPAAQRFGSDRLRAVLNVSHNVSIEQLCDDAASTIEQLQRGDKGDRPFRPPLSDTAR